MTTLETTANLWDAEEYIRISAASFDQTSGHLTLRFCNGDIVSIDARYLLPAGVRAPDWTHSKVVDHYHITVPVAPSTGDLGGDSTEIPGFAIRALTDADFAAHLARQAEEAAHRVGERLQLLRKQRGLTTKEVAARVGMAQQNVSRIEQGRHAVSFPTLEKILAAMGYTLHDLLPIEEDAHSAISKA